jgi:hypothetical protein
MSNPFTIAAQASVSELSTVSSPSILAPRHSPKPKPLAKRQSLHALQLAHSTPITTTTIDSLLVQFRARKDNNADAELDSSDNNLR